MKLILIVLQLFQFTLNKESLSTISAHCEHYIGTQGGGMDQAIAFLATEGEQHNTSTFSIKVIFDLRLYFIIYYD